jgi:hypothetical protein
MDHQSRGWTFLTSHARVLLAIARNPTTRLQEVAAVCRIPERSAQRVVADLEQAGYLSRKRVGRRTEHTVDRAKPLRHPAETGLTVRDLLRFSARPAHQHPDVEGGSVTAPTT